MRATAVPLPALDRGSTGSAPASPHRRATTRRRAYVSTRAGQRQAGWERTARAMRRPRASRRFALFAVVAVFTAWVLPGTGSDSRRVSRGFAFTGSPAQFVVPTGVCRVHIAAAGASGGLQGAAGTPGLGARVAATVRVIPAEVLLVRVGGQGGTAVGVTPGDGGWNGGGEGGSASDAPADDRAAPAPAAAGRPTSGAAQGGSRTASWSPAEAPEAAGMASSAPTASPAAREETPWGTTDSRRSASPIQRREDTAEP